MKNSYEVRMPYEGVLDQMQEVDAQNKFNERAKDIIERIELLEQKIELLSEMMGVRIENGLHLVKETKDEKGNR